jgi:hypothetical protein
MRLPLIALAYVVISLACGIYYCSLAPSPDQSLYDYIAWQGLHGVQWYIGSFDVTWPGNLVIHELGLRLFGVHRWTARLTDFLLLQPALLAIYWFLRTANLRIAPVIGILIYPIIYVTSGPWMAGHRDIVAMHMVVGSAAILLTFLKRGHAPLFFSGLVLGYAVMLRPTYLAFGPVLFIVFFFDAAQPTLRRFATSMLTLAAGTLAIPLLFCVAGVLTHTLDAWLADGVDFVLKVYQVPLSRMRLAARLFVVAREQFLWLAAAGLSSLLLWLSASHVRMHAALLCGMILTTVISFVVQNKGFGYHLGGLIPILTLSALGGIELAGQRNVERWFAWRMPATFVASAVGLIMCVGIERRIQNNLMPFWMGENIRESELTESLKQKIISIITTESTPQSRFFQWGWNYDIGFRSQRLFASRYLDTPLFSLIAPDTLEYGSWLKTFDLDLEINRPTFVLLDLTTLPSESAGYKILATHIDQHYEIRLRLDDKILYKRL